MYIFTPTEEQSTYIVDKYSTENMSSVELAKEFNVHPSTMLKFLHKVVNVRTDTSLNKFSTGHFIDRDCFKKFNDEPSWYFYGLLLADGHLSSKGNYIGISLEQTDREILEKYTSWLKSTVKIRTETTKHYKTGTETTMCCVKFGDKEIRRNLESQGMTPKKSMKESVPNFYNVSHPLARHFWRGMVDGDGSLSRKNTVISLVGSYNICKAFSEFNSMTCGASPKEPRLKELSGLYSIGYSGKDARNIARKLYKDSEYRLERKYEIYLFFEKRANELQDATRTKGVGLIKNGKVLCWYAKDTLSGHQAMRFFRVDKFGCDKAREMAVLCKEDMLKHPDNYH